MIQQTILLFTFIEDSINKNKQSLKHFSVTRSDRNAEYLLFNKKLLIICTSQDRDLITNSLKIWVHYPY